MCALMKLRIVFGRVQIILLLTMALGTAGCSTLQPPDPNGPRGAAYPIFYTTDDIRRNAITASLSYFTLPVNAVTGPTLQPVTMTIESLGPAQGRPLYLPKLGTAAVMTEDETRESLRRFIREWQDLIGSDPSKLSLVARVDQPDGSKQANYEQRPFRYPLRGPYGKLQIRFAADRRVVGMSSTCIPNADRVQAALASVAVKLKSEEVVNHLVNNPISSGSSSGFTVQPPQITPRELVIYVQQSKSVSESLEFHISWEVALKNAPVKTVYVDAVTGEIIATE